MPLIIRIDNRGPCRRKLDFLLAEFHRRTWKSPRLAKRIRKAQKATAAEWAKQRKLERKIKEQIDYLKRTGSRSRILVVNVEPEHKWPAKGKPYAIRIKSNIPIEQAEKIKAMLVTCLSHGEETGQ
jgi:hypothetical protein